MTALIHFLLAFPTYSFATKFATIASLVGIVSFIVFLLQWTVKLVLRISASRRTHQQGARRRAFAQAMLSLTYRDLDTSIAMFTKFIHEQEPAAKRSALSWIVQAIAARDGFPKAESVIKRVLAANPDVLDANYTRDLAVERLHQIALNGDLHDVAKYITSIEEVRNYVGLPELELIQQSSRDAHSFLQALFSTNIRLESEGYLRRLQILLWRSVTDFAAANDSALLAALGFAALSLLSPEELSNSLFVSHLQLFNLKVQNTDARQMIHRLLDDAYRELESYNRFPMYQLHLEHLNSFALSVGHENALWSIHWPRGEVHLQSMRRALERSHAEGYHSLLFSICRRASTDYLFWCKSKIMEEFPVAKEYEFQIYSAAPHGLTERFSEHLDFFVPPFVAAVPTHGSSRLFYLITTEGTNEGKLIRYFDISAEGRMKTLNLVRKGVPDYHSQDFHIQVRPDHITFNWDFETPNATQANIERKVRGRLKLQIDDVGEFAFSIDYPNPALAFLQQTYKEQVRTASKLLGFATIEGNLVRDRNFVNMVREANQYYKKSLIDSIYEWVRPENYPSESAVVLESRPLLASQKTQSAPKGRSGYLICVARKDNEYSVTEIYRYRRARLRKCLFSKAN